MPLHDIRSAALPYCLLLQECGRYALLNREYKPLGFVSRNFVNYSELPILLSVRITPSIAAKLSHNSNPKMTRIYLYRDNCIPTSSGSAWKSYCEKLELLSKLEISERGKGIRPVPKLNLKDAAQQDSLARF